MGGHHRIWVVMALIHGLLGTALCFAGDLHNAQSVESEAKSKCLELEFCGLGGGTAYSGAGNNGWASPGFVVAPGSREVALFPVGEIGLEGGESILVGAANAKFRSESPQPGILFQIISQAVLEEGGAANRTPDPGFFMPHGGRFLCGDWGQVGSDEIKVSLGAICLVLDGELRPTKFWSINNRGGPVRLEVPAPPSTYRMPWYASKFPKGAVCGWRREGGEIFLALTMEESKDGRIVTLLWTGSEWKATPLYDRVEGFDSDRSGGVLPLDLRLAWCGSEFEALLATSEPRRSSKLFRLNWNTGLTQLKLSQSEGENIGQDSLFLVPDRLGAGQASWKSSFTVVHSTQAGYPNRSVGPEDSTSVEFLSVQLGESPCVVERTIRVGSFWAGQRGLGGIRMHSLLFWQGRDGNVRGLFGGQGYFGLTVAGTLLHADPLLEMPTTFRDQANPLQFLGSYSVVFAGKDSDFILAPNLFFGTILQAPSTAPLTIVEIERNTQSISMRAIEPAQFVAKSLQLIQ